MTQAKLYIGFNLIQFNLEIEKILQIYTLFRGLVAKQVQGYLSNYLGYIQIRGVVNNNIDIETIKFLESQVGFKKRFNIVFRDPNKTQIVEINLQRVRQTRSTITYTTKFQKQVIVTNQSNDLLQAQYYKELQNNIKNNLAQDKQLILLNKIITLVIKINSRLYK